MGGNALKGTFTRRYDKAEYFALTEEVVAIASRNPNINYLSVIPAYRGKDSFGDMDILYTTKGDEQCLEAAYFRNTFAPNQIAKNSEVISFDYKELQIDFIHIKGDQFDYALNYYSWNDCGNLVGKLAHQLGLKHGHKGLVLPLRDGNNKFADVLLSLNHSDTLRFLGLDERKFETGFESLDEIFNFIAESPYYNPENYKLENLNSIAKIRDRKRDTYNKFLAFGESWAGKRYVGPADRTVHLQNIFRFFEECYPAYKQAIRDLAVQQLVKEKFNGTIVQCWTGLSGKELGEFMKELRTDWFFEFENILYLDINNIQSRVMKKVDTFNKTRSMHRE